MLAGGVFLTTPHARMSRVCLAISFPVWSDLRLAAYSSFAVNRLSSSVERSTESEAAPVPTVARLIRLAV